MRFGENFLEEVKARVRTSDVVGRHVKLKRQGQEYAGLSPFTNEKTPSFFVNDVKGFYHCFSSGKHGDQISFLMEIEGLSFVEAVEALAAMAGMDMPKSDPDAERRAARNKATISWMERAQEFFEKSLYRNEAEAARDYLKARGLSQTAAKTFGMGYAPDNFSALKDELITQGAQDKQLIEAGLLIEPEDKSRGSWDRFRGRIMFPIHDPRGRLVAFGGRAMAKDAKAKYLNSPETPIFSKGKLLYNYHRARKAVIDHKVRGMIVAEGYMDVIALARAGFGYAVAPLGTALTEDQLTLLWRAGPEPVMCFDGDKAGLRAAYRSIERALPLLRPGQSLRFALLPEGQDPDDLIRAKGPPAMKAILDKAIPLVDMLWQREVEAEPLSTPEAKAGLKARLFAALNTITHEDVKQLYRTELMGRFNETFGFQAQKRGWRGAYKPKEVKSSTAENKAAGRSLAENARRETALLGAILEFPELLEHVDERFFALKFQDRACLRLQRVILSYWRAIKEVEKQALHAHIENEGLLEDYQIFSRKRLLITAAMGGVDAELAERAAIWNAEADALMGHDHVENVADNTRSRMAETIRTDNADVLKRLMRASKDVRD